MGIVILDITMIARKVCVTVVWKCFNLLSRKSKAIVFLEEKNTSKFYAIFQYFKKCVEGVIKSFTLFFLSNFEILI